MRPRQSTTELFTTFLQFDSDRALSWGVDAKLRRNFINCQTALSEPENSQNFWVCYWYKLWQELPDGLAKAHLSAYLQEACYWAVYKIIVHLASTQYTLSDCFQMTVGRVDKVLKGFKPNMGFSLNNYASTIFSSELKEMLRSQNEVDICTNWRLLRKLSQKRLGESLQNLGLHPDIIERYILAWKCYQALYAPKQATGMRRLPKPDQETWNAIAQLYNSQRYTQLSQPGPQLNPQTIEKWLVACAKSVRDYLYPIINSFNVSIKDDDTSGEYQDILPQLQQPAFITEIIAQEELLDRESQQLQVSQVLVTAIDELEPESKKIIQLYYSQGLSQQQIAQELGVKQYAISRKLSKIRDTLLLRLVTWSQASLHISLNSLVLNYISTIVEEWLKTHYHLSSAQLK